MQMSVVLIAILSLVAGVGLGWVIHSLRVGDSAARISVELASARAMLDQAQKAQTETDRQLSEERRSSSAARELAAALEARLDAERTAADEKLAVLLSFDKSLKDSFGSLAAEALDANARQLLALSRAELDKQTVSAGNQLAEKESSIANMLRPMKDQLQQLNAHSQQLEVQRAGAYEAILAEVKNIQNSHMDLRRETTQLVQALRAPKVRGNWGEMQLRRCVEHAGMVEYASFEVEKFVRGEDSSVRPDLIVHLPNQRCIVIDAKTPLESFMNAGGCEDETLRQMHLAGHASAVRKHLDALSSKAYWNRFRESPDFVVCFLPSEVLFSAALEQDPSLLEHSAGSNVLLATPTTLIALLKAVAYGWQQAQIARDAELIQDVAKKLYAKFAGVHGSLLAIGQSLQKAGDVYNDVINKAEGHGGLFSIARKLHSMKIGDKELAESKQVTFLPRIMQHDDWRPSEHRGLSLAASEDADGEPADSKRNVV